MLVSIKVSTCSILAAVAVSISIYHGPPDVLNLINGTNPALSNAVEIHCGSHRDPLRKYHLSDPP